MQNSIFQFLSLAPAPFGKRGYRNVFDSAILSGMLWLLAGACTWSTLPISRVIAEDASPVSFAREVLPILSNKCFVCHGPDAEEGALRLDSVESATADLGGYHAVVPADPALRKSNDSELHKRIHDVDDPMPPADASVKLTEAEREILSRWIEQGGEYKRHWAFVPPQKVLPSLLRELPVNELPLSNLPEKVIDGFVQEKLATRQLQLAPPAEREVLARRAAFTLIGLPPEPEQLTAFLSDTSAEAFPKYVDQLLASPRYGEHQARYWLDAVRYGDTHGLHLDNRRGIYPYRDWVVFALNNNLPWNDFITWQLAGDLLPEPSLEQLVATGYVRMNPSTAEGGVIPAEFQAKNNFDRTETLGTVFLGMTLSCARCHTHKYDPIVHAEYYQLFAFFNSTQESPLDGNSYTYAPVVKAPSDIHGWQQWSELQKQRAEVVTSSKGQLEKLKAELDKALSELPSAAVDRQEELLTALQKPITELQAELNKANELQQNFSTTLVAAELEQPRTTKVLLRGEYDQATGEPLHPDVPTAIGAFPTDAPRNRLGLARWLTSRENPLVTRVLVNRLWQQVFGYGLVRTPEDFGLQGEQPTHPELLDWLAVELQDNGWDVKNLLRTMVLSETFQQSSAWRSDIDDPENRLYARGPSYRLDAEVLRDTGLWASGLLDPRMGGEGVKPYQPDGMWEALAHPASNTKQYQRDSSDKLYRRSIYVYWKRTSPHPMMTLFDAPSREASCVGRSRTSTSLQSLGLLNETMRVEMSRKLAERLLEAAADDGARIDLIFKWLACRSPSEQERQVSEELLGAMRSRYDQAPQDAAELLATGEAPAKPELDPVQVAAWTQLTSILLASDLAIMLY